jgi:hypothetical protein
MSLNKYNPHQKELGSKGPPLRRWALRVYAFNIEATPTTNANLTKPLKRSKAFQKRQEKGNNKAINNKPRH